MKILALETSGLSGSVALLNGLVVVAQCPLDPRQRSAQALAPAIACALQQAGWRATELQLVAVTRGPGSFTGLRIGVTTAKTLAYAVGAAVLGINTLDAIAARTPSEIEAFSAVLDAQRAQLFVADYRRDNSGKPVCVAATRIVDNVAWLANLRPAMTVLGPGLKGLLDRLPAGTTMIAESLWSPQAVDVGRLAFERYQAGARDDVFQFVPDYFRRAAAEEQHDRRLNTS